MSFKPGRLAEVTIATKALAGFCDTLTLSKGIDELDVSVFGSGASGAWKQFIAGMIGETLTLAGSWDPTVTTGPVSVLNAAADGLAAVPCVVYPAGNNAGQGTSHTFNAIVTNVEESAAVNGPCKFSATLRVTGQDVIAQL